MAKAESARSVVLVEGISDQIAIETLAERLGRDLDGEGVVIVPIGGAQAAKHYVPLFAERPGVTVSGLCDRAEAGYFARALAEPVGESVGESDLNDHGFFICDPDLEAELIRSMDPAEIEAVLQSEDDLSAFRTLQKQSSWRDRPFPEQMHRWLRSVGRRNLRYAQLIVLVASHDRLPRPLVDVLKWTRSTGRT
jgi:predicted ATP-dependent endonuclease of OLD family